MTKIILLAITTIACCLLLPTVQAESKPDGIPNYDDAIRPVLKARCFKCHSDDEQEGDLGLQTYAAVVKGGSTGTALQPGKPNSSLLYQSITHTEGISEMPPNADKIPVDEIQLIRRWIQAGMPENSGSEMREAVRVDFAAVVTGRPDKPAMPIRDSNAAQQIPSTTRRHPITALAASPWAPLLAVAGHQHVKLLHSESHDLLKVLPFPEGIPHSIRFSSDGALLLVAGGKPSQSGLAILFDVQSGERLAVYGDEIDVVLAADISADGSLIAIGGPSKTVKVYKTGSAEMSYKIAKHTDWITALSFSSDGHLLATGDRSGGIHLWDASSGGIALSLSEHQDSIHSLDWRRDSRLVASASEDGTVIIWDAKDGWPAATLQVTDNQDEGPTSARTQAFVSATWDGGGKLITIGRDRFVRLWGAAGQSIAKSQRLSHLPNRVVATAGNQIVAGDANGQVWVFDHDVNELRRSTQQTIVRD